MIETARRGVADGIRDFVNKYHVPLLHKHTRECSIQSRDFLIGLYNTKGQLEKLRGRFEGSDLLEFDSIRGFIWDTDNVFLNQANLEIPNQGFIPPDFEEEFVSGTKHIGSLWADIILSDEGLEHISPAVRRMHEIVTVRRPGFVEILTNGNSESPVIKSLDAFNGSTIYLDRLPKKRKFDGHKWTLKIGSVVDINT